jgi:hypothetical protein
MPLVPLPSVHLDLDLHLVLINAPVALELGTNLNGPLAPEVAADVPVERVVEVAPVERLDVESVECRVMETDMLLPRGTMRGVRCAREQK